MRVQRPMGADLALQPQFLAEGRQEQLDGGGVEADAVVQSLYAVRRVDALDRQHGGEDLGLGDRAGIAGEQRLDIEGLASLHHEVDLVAGNVDARQAIDDAIHLGDDDAVLEAGGLDHGRRVFGVWTGIEVAVLVCAHRRDQRHIGRQIDEVAAEQFQIGVHGPELDLLGGQHAGDACALGRGVGEVQLLSDPALEHVQVLGQGHAGLDHVQVMHLARIDLNQGAGQDVGLLLVVALDADPVARLQHRFQESRGVGRSHHLALRPSSREAETAVALRSVFCPVGHRFSARSRTSGPSRGHRLISVHKPCPTRRGMYSPTHRFASRVYTIIEIRRMRTRKRDAGRDHHQETRP